MTLNKVCGSGLKALHLATQAIRCGDAEIIIAGGQENMSLSNYVLPGARTGLRMGHASMVDTMITDGLWDAFNDYPWASPPRTSRSSTTSAARHRMSLPPCLSKGDGCD